MSIDQNKKDLDNAISRMNDRISEMSGILDSCLINDFEQVALEWSNLECDIDEIVSDKEDLESRIEELEGDLAEAKEEE